MAKGILVVGGSGTGKSTSARNLDPKSTFYINVQGKPLPFDDKDYVKCEQGKPPEKGNLYYTDKIKTILHILDFISEKRPDIKQIIVDDTQYTSVNEFMRRISEKGFNKFNDIGHGIWSIPEIIPRLRDDLKIYMMYHDEFFQDENGGHRRAKTMGKLVEQQVGGIEGFFTYVIFTEVEKGEDGIKHHFVVNNEGDTTAKTPMGMFEELRIPNDLTIINDKL